MIVSEHMKSLVVFGAQPASWLGGTQAPQSVTVDGITVGCGVVRTNRMPFDRTDPANARMVRIRVRALSCNYRDKGIVFGLRAVPSNRFTAIGSEFVAEVVGVGPEVVGLAPGDRVVPDQHYTGKGIDDEGVAEGVITNQGSREYQTYHFKRLVRVPDAMPSEVAAGFSLNAQTAYSMVRRLGVERGMKVLVTAAGSNTSLFLIGALRARDAEVYVTTSTERFVPRLEALGVAGVLRVDRGEHGFRKDDRVTAFARDLGGFDHVADPFYDLHLEKAVELLKPFGKYITCGLAGQNPNSKRAAGVEPVAANRVMTLVILKNLSIVGNCIGVHDDLRLALKDYSDGRLRTVVDSVHGETESRAFLDRTFNDRERFGKVVFRYED